MLTIRGGRIDWKFINGVFTIRERWAAPIITIDNNCEIVIDATACDKLTIYANDNVECYLGKHNTIYCGDNSIVDAVFQCTVMVGSDSTLNLGKLNNCTIGDNSTVNLSKDALNIINKGSNCVINGDATKCIII